MVSTISPLIGLFALCIPSARSQAIKALFKVPLPWSGVTLAVFLFFVMQDYLSILTLVLVPLGYYCGAWLAEALIQRALRKTERGQSFYQEVLTALTPPVLNVVILVILQPLGHR